MAMPRSNLLFRHLVAAVVLGLSTPAYAGETAAVDFIRDIQPIFRESCLQCHDAKKHKADLRFDNQADAMRGGESGKAILPGHSKDSLIMKRVRGEGDDDRMPVKKPPLSEGQIALLARWIDEGAAWPQNADGQVAKKEVHWSYVSPVRQAPPQVKHERWVKNAIDHFIAARLEKEGLEPSAEASRPALIRRVSLDLVGLPPTPEQVDAFVNDTSANAYENVVDRLLASPHYGERWARPWLDLARYADSNGFEKDRVRSMWPYRDWVINALNQNIPFDEFTIKQIAGDLLPNATMADKIATGFHRNTTMNEEGGVDAEEYRYYAVVDRVNTTSTTWLGSTIGCSQCHNHKYDPFTMKDYYRLTAFFNSTAEETNKRGGTDPQDVSAKLTVESPEVKDAEAEIARLNSQLTTPTPQLKAAEAEWEKQIASPSVEWTTLGIKKITSAGGATFEPQADGSIFVSGTRAERDVYTIIAGSPVKNITAFRLEMLTDDRLPNKGPGRAENGNFVLSRISISADGAEDKATPVALKDPSADFSQNEFSPAAAIVAKADERHGWAVAPKWGEPHQAIFQTAKNVSVEGSGKLTIVLEQQLAQHTLGRFRISVTNAARPVKVGGVPSNIAAIVNTPSEKRSEAQTRELLAHYGSFAPMNQPIREQIAQANERLKRAKEFTTTLVMSELPKPRETRMHVRGAFLVLGESVESNVPGNLPRLPATRPSDPPRSRMDLAKWLVSPQNPLTARVTVNRFWEAYFGKGIVETSEDFGVQGSPPTHPELLDWLAVEFTDRHWDMKAIHKLIVMSATYRQSSEVSQQLLERDPLNKLLARGPRHRLEAELLRDQALAVSGLLSEKMGGPSVYPPQPPGIWNTPYSGEQWIESKGADKYRRGIYTFMKRSAPYPMFITFDASSRESICTRRPRTDTPLQALTTLNDPSFVQPAAALARRIAREGGADVNQQIAYAFKRVLCRQPEPAEVVRIAAIYQQQLENYQKDPKAAAMLASSGLEEPMPANVPAPELAAWTVVSNVLLNLDETLTKG